MLMPDFRKPFILYNDACREEIGSVLCQEDAEKKLRPNAFYSRKLTAREKKLQVDISKSPNLSLWYFLGNLKFRIRPTVI